MVLKYCVDDFSLFARVRIDEKELNRAMNPPLSVALVEMGRPV